MRLGEVSEEALDYSASTSTSTSTSTIAWLVLTKDINLCGISSLLSKFCYDQISKISEQAIV